MFKSKYELDKHVQDVLSKLQGEREKAKRCFNIAKQYAGIREFVAAKQYMERYLNSNPANEADALKLMGDFSVETAELERALDYYKASYKQHKNREALTRICDLLERGCGTREDQRNGNHKWFELLKSTEATSPLPLYHDSNPISNFNIRSSIGTGPTGQSKPANRLSNPNVLTITPTKYVVQAVNGVGSHEDDFAPKITSSPERTESKIHNLERRYDDILAKILGSVERIESDMKDLRGKVDNLSSLKESLEKSVTSSKAERSSKSNDSTDAKKKVGNENSFNPSSQIQQVPQMFQPNPAFGFGYPFAASPFHNPYLNANPMLAALYGNPLLGGIGNPLGAAGMPRSGIPQVATVLPNETSLLAGLLSQHQFIPPISSLGAQPVESLYPQVPLQGSMAVNSSLSDKLWSQPQPVLPTVSLGQSFFSNPLSSAATSVSSTVNPVNTIKTEAEKDSNITVGQPLVAQPPIMIGSTETKTKTSGITPAFAPVTTSTFAFAATSTLAAANTSTPMLTSATTRAPILTSATNPTPTVTSVATPTLTSATTRTPILTSATTRTPILTSAINPTPTLTSVATPTFTSVTTSTPTFISATTPTFTSANTPKFNSAATTTSKLTSATTPTIAPTSPVVSFATATKSVSAATPILASATTPVEKKEVAKGKALFPENVVVSNTEKVPTVPSSSYSNIMSVTIPPEHRNVGMGLGNSNNAFNFQIAAPKLKPLEPSVDKKSEVTENPFSNIELKAANAISFGDLASSGVSTAFTGGKNSFEGQTKQVFANVMASDSATSDAGVRSDKERIEGDEVADDFVPTAEFQPVIPLPPLVEVKKGNENENVLFEHRAKIYRFVTETKEWKERGVGNIMILQDKDDDRKIRVVMWRERVYKLACNHRINKDLVIENHQGSPKVLKWTAMDFAEGDGDGKLEIFTCRFGQENKCAEFKATMERMVAFLATQGESSPQKENTKVLEQPKIEQKPLSELFKKSAGSWDCGACYVNNTAKDSKCLSCGTPNPLPQVEKTSAVEPPKDGMSSGVPQLPSETSLSGGLQSQNQFVPSISSLGAQPFESFYPQAPLQASMPVNSSLSDKLWSQPQPVLPTVSLGQSFFPNPLSSAATFVSSTVNPVNAVKTEAEKDSNITVGQPLVAQPPIMIGSTETKTKTSGITPAFAPITTSTFAFAAASTFADVTVPARPTFTFATTPTFTSVTTPTVSSTTPVLAFSSAPTLFTDTETKLASATIPPLDSDITTPLDSANTLSLDSAITPPLDSTTTQPSDSTTTPPLDSATTPILDSATTPVGKKEAKGKTLFPENYVVSSTEKVPTVPSSSFSNVMSVSTPSEQRNVGMGLGNSNNAFNFQFAAPTFKPLEPSVDKKSEVTQNPFSNIELKAATAISFGDLASSGVSTAFTGGKNSFEGQKKQVFGNVMASGSATGDAKERVEGDEVADDFVPTAEFQPVIPLPPLVEVKKGNENENVLFEHRAKIYRFVTETKEWKERGVGNIMILQDKDDDRKIRVVMWRERVYKLACNHRINKDLVIENHQGSPKVLKWTAMDFAEGDGDGKLEIFTCRFGQEDKCAELKATMERMIAFLATQGESSPQKEKTDVVVQPVLEQKPLSELFKKSAGSWDCGACYVNNTANDSNCLSCGTPNPFPLVD